MSSRRASASCVLVAPRPVRIVGFALARTPAWRVAWVCCATFQARCVARTAATKMRGKELQFCVLTRHVNECAHKNLQLAAQLFNPDLRVPPRRSEQTPIMQCSNSRKRRRKKGGERTNKQRNKPQTNEQTIPNLLHACEKNTCACPNPGIAQRLQKCILCPLVALPLRECAVHQPPQKLIQLPRLSAQSCLVDPESAAACCRFDRARGAAAGTLPRRCTPGPSGATRRSGRRGAR